MRTRVANRATPILVEIVQALVSAACVPGRMNLAGFILVSFVALLRTGQAVELMYVFPPRKHSDPGFVSGQKTARCMVGEQVLVASGRALLLKFTARLAALKLLST